MKGARANLTFLIAFVCCNLCASVLWLQMMKRKISLALMLGLALMVVGAKLTDAQQWSAWRFCAS